MAYTYCEEEKYTSEFWNKVMTCKHKNTSDTYYEFGECTGTPHCSYSEVRCNDCKAYITTCDCGFENLVSGWTRYRYWREIKKK